MPKPQTPLNLKLYRALLLVGGIVIIGFGPLYQLVEPRIVDPLWNVSQTIPGTGSAIPPIRGPCGGLSATC